MAEFSDTDLYEDQPEDSTLLRQLRKELRKKTEALTEANKKIESAEKESRTTTLERLLTDKGAKAKLARFIPADVEATPEAVDAWIDEYSDVFNIQRSETGEAEPSGEAQEQTATGATAEEKAAHAAIQTTQTGGQPTPQLRGDQTRALLAELDALPAEDAFKRMRELGLMA